MLKAASSNKAAMHTPRIDQSSCKIWLGMILATVILCSAGLLYYQGNLIRKKPNRNESLSPSSRDEPFLYSVLNIRLDEWVYDIDGVALGDNTGPKRKSTNKQYAMKDLDRTIETAIKGTGAPSLKNKTLKLFPLVKNPERMHSESVQKEEKGIRSETPDVYKMDQVVEAKVTSSIAQHSPTSDKLDSGDDQLTGKSSKGQQPMKEAKLNNENTRSESDELTLKVGPPRMKSIVSLLRTNENKGVRPGVASGGAGLGEYNVYIDTDDSMVDTEDGDADEYEDLFSGSGDDGHTQDTEPLQDTGDGTVGCGAFICWRKAEFCDHVTRTCVHCSEICGDSRNQAQRAPRPGLMSSQYMCAYHCPGFRQPLRVANALDKLRLFKLRR